MELVLLLFILHALLNFEIDMPLHKVHLLLSAPRVTSVLFIHTHVTSVRQVLCLVTNVMCISYEQHKSVAYRVKISVCLVWSAVCDSKEPMFTVTFKLRL